MLSLYEKRSITLEELREWVKDRTGVDLFDDEKIEAEKEEYEQQKQDMMDKDDKPMKEDPKKKEYDMETLRHVFQRKDEILQERSKKKRLIEAEDDCSWVTINGAKVCIKSGESPEDALNRTRGSVSSGKNIMSGIDKKQVDTTSTKAEDFRNSLRTRDDLKVPQSELSPLGNPEENRKDYVKNTVDGLDKVSGKGKLDDIPLNEKRWEILKENNPQLRNELKSMQTELDTNVNKPYQEVYDKTSSIYRGARATELDDILNTGKLGGDKNGYGFVSSSIDPEVAGRFNTESVIEFDADSVRSSDSKLVNYSAEPTPYATYGNTMFGPEGINRSMPAKFADEVEVRIPENLKVGTEIKIKQVILTKQIDNLDSLTSRLDKAGIKYHIEPNTVARDNYLKRLKNG